MSRMGSIGWITRIWRRIRGPRQRGVSVALFSLGLIVMVGVGGLAIDGTGMYVTRIEAQSAADSAALAAAAGSCQGKEVVVSKARQMGQLNGIGSEDIEVEWPYRDNSDLVRVVVSKPFAYRFLAALGFEQTTIRADAVAEVTSRADATFQSTLAAFGRSEVDLLGNAMVDSYDSRVGTYDSQRDRRDDRTGIEFADKGADVRSDCLVAVRGANLLAGSAITADGGPSPWINWERTRDRGHWSKDRGGREGEDDHEDRRRGPRFVIKPSGIVEVNRTSSVTIQVLGKALQYGPGGPAIPVYCRYSIDDGEDWNHLGGGRPVSGGESVTIRNLEAGSGIAILGRARYEARSRVLFDRTYASNQRDEFDDDASRYHQYTLRNGDPSPTTAGYAGQRGVEDYLAPHIDASTGRIKLGEEDAIFLFEFTDRADSSAADFQDLVVLARFSEGETGEERTEGDRDRDPDDSLALLGRHTSRDGDRLVRRSGRSRDRMGEPPESRRHRDSMVTALRDLADDCREEGRDHVERSRRLWGARSFREESHGTRLTALGERLEDLARSCKDEPVTVVRKAAIEIRKRGSGADKDDSDDGDRGRRDHGDEDSDEDDSDEDDSDEDDSDEDDSDEDAADSKGRRKFVFRPGVRAPRCDDCGILSIRGSRNHVLGSLYSDGPIVLQGRPEIDGRELAFYDTPELWSRIKRPDWTIVAHTDSNGRLDGVEGWDPETRDLRLAGEQDVSLPAGNYRIHDVQIAGQATLRVDPRVFLWVDGSVRIGGLARVNPTESPDRLVFHMRAASESPRPRRRQFRITPTGAIEVDSAHAMATVRVLAKQLQYGAGGPHIPIHCEVSVDDGHTFAPMFDGRAVREGDQLSLPGLWAGQKIVVRARARLRSGRSIVFDKTYVTNERDPFPDERERYHQNTLENGDAVPKISAFAGQVALGDSLAPLVDRDSGTLSLGESDAIYLLEFGSRYDTPAADFQDLALLVTFEETNEHGTVVRDGRGSTSGSDTAGTDDPDGECRILPRGHDTPYIARGGSRVAAIVFNDHGDVDIGGYAEHFGQLVSGGSVMVHGAARLHLDRAAARLIEPCAVSSRLKE